MKKKKHTLDATLLFCAILLISCPAAAVEIFFQPRVETGVMHYTFESESVSESTNSSPGFFNSGSGFTQKQFEFSDWLHFIGAGGTFFLGRLFLDFSGRYAVGGKDTSAVAYSGFEVLSDDAVDIPAFLSNEIDYTARFDRSDTAVALGYAFSRRFCLFAGYKWAETQFETTFQGTYSSVLYSPVGDPDYHITGRSWGEADYRFAYQGPFMGLVQSWDCRRGDFLKGMFTTNLALAHLEGKVVLERRYQYVSITSLDGQPVPEVSREGDMGPVARHNTAGDAWGLTLGAGWRGETALDGLSYSVGMSGYRYEFDAEHRSESDINETALVFKIGLTYLF